ncbi:xanthine/uracil permease [Mycena alexandri]|uniref:Xanthine/uracil permease n=1 Tax=Mycena alexandri TaxID=1745969 RepID=A0AAD6RVL7_9AGAR|nr:xanthine/uracil permease [Mycena alexandri]
MDVQPGPTHHGFMTRVSRKVATQEGWLGEYDYGWLCLPSLPFSNKAHDPPILCPGCRVTTASRYCLITPPIIFASALSLDSATSSYMISASLIGSGILSLVQISRIPLFGGYYLGTGLISVVGTSFSTLSTANAIVDAMYRDGTCSSTTAPDGTVTRNACPEAYGKLLGTSLICSFLEMFLAFVPPRVLKRIFPPMITGTVVLLIGARANGCQNFPTSGIFELCPTIFAPRPLLWGSPEFIGLGFLSFLSIILTELFGSPFLKNISIIVGLAVGCIVAGAVGYIDGSSIKSAPAITFLWVHRFKIGVYPPAILPSEPSEIFTASAEVSRIDVRGLEFDSRVQGGVLSDAIGGFFSALFTVTPLSIFAQNNGVIAITRCANRAAGRWCCVFLILFGVLVPNSVLGGVTTFLFASVAVSGLRVLSFARYTRRDRFVLAAALSLGLGDLLVPQLFTHLFDRVKNPNNALQGFFDSITIILSTPFLAAGIIGVILNIILPKEPEESTAHDDTENDPEKQSESTEGRV